MRRLARLLPYLAVLLLPLVALVVLLRAGPLAAHLRAVIENELSRQLDREVSIGSASVGLSGRVVLRDVVVENEDGSRLLAAPEVSARVGREGSWVPVLSGMTDVREVKLSRPEISLVRDAEGELTVGDLVARQAERPSQFRGRVVVEDGRLVFVDETRGGLATVLEGADFSLQQSGDGGSAFSLKARGPEGAFASLKVEGRRDAETGETSLSGSVHDLDISYALARAPEMEALSISRGRGNVAGSLTIGRQNPDGTNVAYDVEVAVADAEVSFPWLRRPLADVNGTVRFVDGDVHLTGISCTLAGAPVAAEGMIEDLSDPRLALEVSVSGIRYEQVRALLPGVALPLGIGLPSPVHIAAHVEGPASDVRVTGEAKVRVIEFRAIPWNDLVGRFEYSKGRLGLSELRAHGSPRRLAGDLVVDWSAGQSAVEGSIELTDVPLSTLAQMAGIDSAGLLGTAWVQATVRSDGEQSLAGEFKVSGAVVQGLHLGRVEGEFELAGQSVSARGRVSEGSVGSGRFSTTWSAGGGSTIEAEFSSLDLSAVGAALGRPGVSGMLAGTAMASWDPRAVSGSGSLVLGPGEVAGRAFESVSATVDVSPVRLQVSDLVLVMGEGEYRSESLSLTGWAGEWSQARMEGSLSVQGVALADWLPPQYAVEAPEGRVDGEIELWGSPADPGVGLNLRLRSLRVAGRPIESGQVVARYERGGLAIEEMFLSDRGSRLVVSGGYDPRAGLNLGVGVDPLKLSRIAPATRRRYGVILGGEITGAAKVTGPLEDPRIEFRAESDSLVVNGEEVDDFAVSGRFEEGALRADSLLVRVAGGMLSILDGVVDLREQTVSVELRLADLDLGRLYQAGYLSVWRLARAGVRSPYLARYAEIPHPLTGLLTAEVRVEGSLDALRVTTDNMSVSGLGYGGRQIGRIEGDPDDADVRLLLGVEQGRLVTHEALVNLRASDAMGDAQISGGITPDGEISLVVDSLGYLDLSLLGPWLQYPLDLDGRATVNFDVSGPVTKPVVVGDVLVDQLRLGPFRAEQATASPISVEEGVLKVEQRTSIGRPALGGSCTSGTAASCL